MRIFTKKLPHPDLVGLGGNGGVEVQWGMLGSNEECQGMVGGDGCWGAVWGASVQRDPVAGVGELGELGYSGNDRVKKGVSRSSGGVSGSPRGGWWGLVGGCFEMVEGVGCNGGGGWVSWST